MADKKLTATDVANQPLELGKKFTELTSVTNSIDNAPNKIQDVIQGLSGITGALMRYNGELDASKEKGSPVFSDSEQEKIYANLQDYVKVSQGFLNVLISKEPIIKMTAAKPAVLRILESFQRTNEYWRHLVLELIPVAVDPLNATVQRAITKYKDETPGQLPF